MIDLGSKSGAPETVSSSSKSKVYYPSLYISGVEDMDIEPGDITFTAKGRVVSCTERTDENGKTTCSCEIEVQSIDPTQEGEGLDGAMKKIAKKKMASTDSEGPSDANDPEESDEEE